ncbi:MAG TPA: hypothetical protein VJN32_00100 [Dehalococcoidia bacterium]|nr:hypothetical protein [Dehalococcoidia bacterium]
MKIVHRGCKGLTKYGLQRGHTLRLYVRDPATRSNSPVGFQCQDCGALRLDHWPAWVNLQIDPPKDRP